VPRRPWPRAPSPSPSGSAMDRRVPNRHAARRWAWALYWAPWSPVGGPRDLFGGEHAQHPRWLPRGDLSFIHILLIISAMRTMPGIPMFRDLGKSGDYPAKNGSHNKDSHSYSGARSVPFACPHVMMRYAVPTPATVQEVCVLLALGTGWLGIRAARPTLGAASGTVSTLFDDSCADQQTARAVASPVNPRPERAAARTVHRYPQAWPPQSPHSTGGLPRAVRQ
jgi:hypothetical protein